MRQHPEVIYAEAENLPLHRAKALLKKIAQQELSTEFTIRDFMRKNWREIGDQYESIEEALAILEAHGYIRKVSTQKVSQQTQVGRPSESYLINPQLFLGKMNGWSKKEGIKDSLRNPLVSIKTIQQDRPNSIAQSYLTQQEIDDHSLKYLNASRGD